MPRTTYELDEAEDNYQAMRRATEMNLSANGGRMIVKDKEGRKTQYDFPGTSYPKKDDKKSDAKN